MALTAQLLGSGGRGSSFAGRRRSGRQWRWLEPSRRPILSIFAAPGRLWATARSASGSARRRGAAGGVLPGVDCPILSIFAVPGWLWMTSGRGVRCWSIFASHISLFAHLKRVAVGGLQLHEAEFLNVVEHLAGLRDAFVLDVEGDLHALVRGLGAQLHPTAGACASRGQSSASAPGRCCRAWTASAVALRPAPRARCSARARPYARAQAGCTATRRPPSSPLWSCRVKTSPTGGNART